MFMFRFLGVIFLLFVVLFIAIIIEESFFGGRRRRHLQRKARAVQENRTPLDAAGK